MFVIETRKAHTNDSPSEVRLPLTMINAHRESFLNEESESKQCKVRASQARVAIGSSGHRVDDESATSVAEMSTTQRNGLDNGRTRKHDGKDC
jgi:hypothetical protein